ncbi:MAG: Palmitoyltransferase [Bogoriella megaspora]|nr:MAG: Palmitoyltransferase [Bogoriella megaspora]
MDHHCPWTSNCVSHRTLPHFLRFLFYSVASMTFLSYHLYAHSYPIWATRKFPSYLGPSVFQLTHLFVLLITNSLTWFALTILLFRTLWSLVTNTTTIEAWEIERHETLLRRAKYFGGWLDGPDGSKVRIVRQEFPYDIGVWRNVVQGMGTANPVGWFWVLGKDMGRGTGWEWEVNGFEESGRTWPPPDPDRMPRRRRGWVVDGEGPFVHDNGDVEGFRRRQEEDLRRRRRRPFVERLEARQAGREVGDFESSDGEDVEDEIRESPSQRRDYVATRGEEDWKNAEGESLADFGLDEDAEFYDEEDVPLSELMRRKRLQRSI